jgi:hypothetical protein
MRGTAVPRSERPWRRRRARSLVDAQDVEERSEGLRTPCSCREGHQLGSDVGLRSQMPRQKVELCDVSFIVHPSQRVQSDDGRRGGGVGADDILSGDGDLLTMGPQLVEHMLSRQEEPGEVAVNVDVYRPLVMNECHRVFFEAVEEPEVGALMPAPTPQGVDELLETPGIDQQIDIGRRAGGP